MASLPEVLRRALAGPLPGLGAQLRMAPRLRTELEPSLVTDGLRPAAGLLLAYPHAGAWHVLLTVRGSSLRHHTGQVSLPGGRIDPGESVEHAALREAHEEVAVDPAFVEVVGQLTPVPIAVSEHLLHPVVALAPQRPAFRAAEAEVERLLEERTRARPPYSVMDVPYFDIEDVHIWGATAMVLAEFLALVEEADV
jgi:8-oxo-dGTP pyrophosphatase MutT (NUDIX family)